MNTVYIKRKAVSIEIAPNVSNAQTNGGHLGNSNKPQNTKTTTYTSLPNFLPTVPHTSPTTPNDPAPGIDEGGGSAAFDERLLRSTLLLDIPEYPRPSASRAQTSEVDMPIAELDVP